MPSYFDIFCQFCFVDNIGNAKSLKIAIELKGEPVRLGIEWKTDESEPTVVVISDVVKSSPADLAQLKINDRIYEIGDKPFKSSDEFQKRATTIPLPFNVLVEREGLLNKIEIQSTRWFFQSIICGDNPAFFNSSFSSDSGMTRAEPLR